MVATSLRQARACLSEGHRDPRHADATPPRLLISRHYGCPLHRAPRTEDGRLARAGLLARGSIVSSHLPDATRQWHIERRLAAYSCGGSHGFDASRIPPRSLFTRQPKGGRDRRKPIRLVISVFCQSTNHADAKEISFYQCLASFSELNLNIKLIS